MKVKLGELTKIRTGKLDANASSEDGQYPFFTCSREPLRIATYSYDCECVLVAGNGDLNVKYYNGKFDAYQRTYIIEDNGSGKLYMPYLYFFMDGYVEELRKQAIGGVIRYIKLGNLTDALIELPDINIQKMIVDILAKAKEITSDRMVELQKLDDLIKARFVELFGDPVEHLDRGETVSLEKIADRITVGFVGEASNEYVDEGVPYLRTQNVRVNHIDLSGLIYVNEAFHNKNQKSIIHPGDIVISRVGVNRGMAAVIPNSINEANIANCLIVGQTNEINSFYLAFYLNMSYGKRPQFGASVGSAQGVVNTSILKKWEVYVPDRVLQDEFNLFMEQVDKSKVA